MSPPGGWHWPGSCGASAGDGLGQGRKAGRRVGAVAKAGRRPCQTRPPRLRQGRALPEQITVAVGEAEAAENSTAAGGLPDADAQPWRFPTTYGRTSRASCPRCALRSGVLLAAETPGGLFCPMHPLLPELTRCPVGAPPLLALPPGG